MHHRSLALLSLLLLPLSSFSFSSASSGSSTTYSGFTAGSGNIGKYVVSTASDGTVLVSSGGRLSVPGGSIPITITGSIPKPSAAAAVGRFLGKSIPVLGAGVALFELAQELGFSASNASTGGVPVLSKQEPEKLGYFDNREYSVSGSNVWYPDAQTPCNIKIAQDDAADSGASYSTVTSFSNEGVSTTCLFTRTFVSGQTPNTGGIVISNRAQLSAPPPLGTVTATPQEFADAVAARSGWPQTSALARTVRDGLLAGDALDVDSPVVTGPAQVEVQRTTEVNPATGNTTTTVVTISNTYNGPTVTTTSTTTQSVTNTSTGAPVGQPTVTTTSQPVVPSQGAPSEDVPFTLPCGIAGTPPCAVKVDESQTPTEVPADEFKPLLDEGKQAQEDLLDQVKSDTDKSFFEPFTDLFVTPALAECVPLEIPGDRGTIDPCGTVGGARAIMAYIWALSGLALCLHMVRSAL